MRIGHEDVTQNTKQSRDQKNTGALTNDKWEEVFAMMFFIWSVFFILALIMVFFAWKSIKRGNK